VAKKLGKHYEQGCQVQKDLKGQLLKIDKRPNKGQLSFKKFIKTTKLKLTIS
jgi:hypothetical protein